MSAPERTNSFSGTNLLCKNECGFYGNPQWQGYCSLCYRKLNRNLTEALNEEVTPWFDLASVLSFEDKKKDSKRTSLSSLFQSSTSESPDPKELERAGVTSPTPKNEQIARQIFIFVDKRTKEFLIKHQRSSVSADELGDTIATFYEQLSALLMKKYPELNDDPELLPICLERAEETLTSSLYARLFAPEEDESLDLELQKAIRQFHWIGPAMLGAHIDRSLDSVRDLLDQAVNQILQTNAETLPSEKLRRLSSACECMMKVLGASMGRSAGADDMMPALIFLLLHTNPPLFKSNLALIRRLAPPETLRRGECAYHYCSICSAVSFIERGITEKDLNLTRRQFHQFLTNEDRPPHSLMEMNFSKFRNEQKIGGIFEESDGGEFTSPALERIKKLKEKNTEFFIRARELREQMTDFSQSVTKEVHDILETYPLKLDESETSEPPASSTSDKLLESQLSQS